MRRALLAVVLIGLLSGCCTAKCCEKFVREPEVVTVPVYVPPPELPVPAEPEWQTCDADPTDWQAYLRALAEDLLAALAQNAELRYITGDDTDVVQTSDEWTSNGTASLDGVTYDSFTYDLGGGNVVTINIEQELNKTGF